MKTNYFYSQLNYSLPRTAIEAEILFAARVMQTRFLGAVIKPVHPCTGLIARFAEQNALLLRTTDIRVGTEKKNTAGTKQQRQKDWSGKRGADTCVPLHCIDDTQVSAVRQKKGILKKKHCAGGFSAYDRKRKNETF